MFEKITIQLLNECHEESSGSLQCLPYSRALIDALTCLGKNAYPLVIRGVVFGRQEDSSIYRKVGVQGLVQTALNAPSANGWLDVRVDDAGQTKTVRFHYRTIGLPDKRGEGDETLGNYDGEGKWLGHLAVIVDDNLIDPTIGQLNDDRSGICFNPPAVTAPVTEAFLTGSQPLVFIVDGMLVAYFSYPDEQTHKRSRSWTDADFRAQLKAIGERTAAPFDGKPETELHAEA